MVVTLSFGFAPFLKYVSHCIATFTFLNFIPLSYQLMCVFFSSSYIFDGAFVIISCQLSCISFHIHKRLSFPSLFYFDCHIWTCSMYSEMAIQMLKKTLISLSLRQLYCGHIFCFLIEILQCIHVSAVFHIKKLLHIKLNG